MAATTTVPTPPEPAPSSGSGRTKKLIIAAVVAVVVVLGIKVLFTVWWRRGGPRRAVSGLVEGGAVQLADALLDEVFPAA
jgi:hypothetical protein